MSEDCNRTKAQQLFDEAWTLKLPPNEKLVLMSMAAASDEDGVYRQGPTFLVLDTEYSPSQIKRLTKALIEGKFIREVTTKIGRRPAAYGLTLTDHEQKLTSQNDYMKRSNSEDLSGQNEPIQNDYVSILGGQNDPITHSLPDLTTQNDDIKIVGEIPPKNPPIKTNTRTVKDATNAARAPVDDLLDWLKVKDPMRQFDRADLEKQMQLFTAEWVRDAFEQGYSTKKLDRPMGYMINTCKGWLANGKPDKTPPSSATPPSNGKTRSPELDKIIRGDPQPTGPDYVPPLHPSLWPKRKAS